MSNERKKPGQDTLVAETYKSVARERVPEQLNERVLRLAADAGRNRYARARAWMRPAAWAATIGLSLAIVLQLTQLPQIESVPVGITSSDQIAVPGDAANDEDIVREDIAAAEQAPSSEPPAVRDDAQRSRPATPAAERQGREAMDQFAPKDMSVLREAENRARLQAGPDQPAAATAAETKQDLAEIDEVEVEAEEMIVNEVVLDEEVAAEPVAGFAASRSLAATVDKKEAAADSSCPAGTQENAHSWYRCIEDLRARGLDELANSEYEHFRRIFPDFVDPSAE